MTDKEPDAHRIPIDGTLDLHTFAPGEIPSVVDEYIHAAHAAGLRDLRLIHGRGIGVQRTRVQQVLRAHALVESYGDAPESHLGATVVRLTGSSITETPKHKDALGQ
jgi:DNA-nicking Smr family endonuclease